MNSQTPMINQYKKIKNDYPDSILMFRLGDFYEMLFDDAKTASKILGIALTSRNRTKGNPIPLCGVPYHSVEPYISKLLDSGNKVAICEQIKDADQSKGIVNRKVVKVLTPGVVLDSEKLESKNNNYIASIYKDKQYGLSFGDISTGEFRTTLINSEKELITELFLIEPKELLVDPSFKEELVDRNLFLGLNPLLTEIESWKWEVDRCEEMLLNELAVQTLEPFDISGKPQCVVASGILFDYIKETQLDFMPTMENPKYYTTLDHLNIDESTKRNLELTKSNSGGERHSLLWVLDQTQTAMGARLIRNWINYPLLDINQIENRQNGIGELIENQGLLESLTDGLKNINDIERLISRISTASARPRDLASLRDSSDYISSIKELLSKFRTDILNGLYNTIDDYGEIKQFLEKCIVDNPPVTAKDGGVIKEGYNAELDELRAIQRDGRSWISNLEISERKATGINSLKVSYNKVFGYYIEIRNTNLSLVPDHYIRRQTLANSERYITPELKEYEDKIVNAQERILTIENELFEEIRKKVARESSRIRLTASKIAELDVLCSLSNIALNNGYIKPKLSPTTGIVLKGCRHPVIERINMEAVFIPNDIELDAEKNQFLVITGPNMAGKSTLIRQVALVVLMAQMGSFIPAESAEIGIVDRIFSRVGATDNLTKGQSTFMVEMVETAYILRNATNKSLVILDEIGRGTSTFDGISIAWAVSEYLHDIGCLTLFATHYHELANLQGVKDRVQNYNVMVKQNKGEIIFLRKLQKGSTSHSYGIQVAKLAGIPQNVLSSARNILKSLENLQSKLSETITGEQFILFEDNSSDIIIDEMEDKIVDEIKGIDPMNISPIEALNKLIELKNKVEK